MSVTSGFFNSLNNDRRYNAEQLSSIFDGVINDGVFANIGTAFNVKANSGLNITVGIGKAWFNSSWLLNDSILPLTLDVSEMILDRIDAVVIEIDHTESVRSGSIKVIKGTPSSNPVYPTLINQGKVHQYPLAYVLCRAGSEAIDQADITNMVGTSSCPYITGILEVQNIDNIVAQWEAQWERWFADETNDANQDMSAWLSKVKSDFDNWFNVFKFGVEEEAADASAWMIEVKSDFDSWFNSLQTVLEEDVATQLASKIVELMGKFAALSEKHSISEELIDSNGNPVLDNNNNVIKAKTVFTTPDDVKNLTNNIPASNIICGSGFNKRPLENGGKVVADEAINSTMLGNKSPDYYIQHKNLLDNSDFRNPVYQRNPDYYDKGTVESGYFIDRWSALSKLNYSFTDEGMSVNKGIAQWVNKNLCVGKTITIAAEINGVVYTASAEIPYQLPNEYYTFCKSSTGIASIECVGLDEVGIMFYIRPLNDNVITIKWAAIYIGKYTADTLPRYTPKGYASELLECQRYYYSVRNISSFAGYKTNILVYVDIPIPIRMRFIPTFSADYMQLMGTKDNEGSLFDATEYNYSMDNNVLHLTLMCDQLSKNQAIVCTTRGVELSAEP